MRGLLIACLVVLFPHIAVAADIPNAWQVEMRTETDPPDAWRSVSLSEVDPHGQLVWVRRRFEVSASSISSGTPMAIHVFAPASYEAWWNGTFIGRNGIPGHSRESETPGRIQGDILIPAHLLRPGTNELMLRMSSFHLRSRLSMVVQALEIGEFGNRRYEPIHLNVFRLMTAGALLLAAVYFGALYLSNRREVSSLLLAMLSVSVLGQLLSESIRFLVNYLYPFHIVRLWLIAGFACISTLLLVSYVGLRYSRARLPLLVMAAAVLSAISLVLVRGYDGKTYTVILVGLVLSGVAAALGLRASIRGAGVVLGLVVASIALAFVNAYVFLDLAWYLAIVALLFTLFGQQVTELRRAQRAQSETELRSARLELELLRQQIQPHFLMNTLTALCEWVESDPKVGVKMIDALGEELRAIAAMGEATTVPLGQEIELCRSHLRVMGFKRNKQFTLKTDGVDPDARVPPAILHTLIENAFTHNGQADGAEFLLSGRAQENGRYRCELRSPLARTGRSECSGKGNASGKGHAYVRARLRHAFADNWFFSASAVAGEWVDCVEVPGRAACT